MAIAAQTDGHPGTLQEKGPALLVQHDIPVIDQPKRRPDLLLPRRFLPFLHPPEAAEGLEADVERAAGLPGDGKRQVDHGDDLLRNRHRLLPRKTGRLRDRTLRDPLAHLLFQTGDLGKGAAADLVEPLPGEPFSMGLDLDDRPHELLLRLMGRPAVLPLVSPKINPAISAARIAIHRIFFTTRLLSFHPLQPQRSQVRTGVRFHGLPDLPPEGFLSRTRLRGEGHERRFGRETDPLHDPAPPVRKLIVRHLVRLRQNDQKRDLITTAANR